VEDEEQLLEKVSLLLVITVVFLKIPPKYPDYKNSETRSASEQSYKLSICRKHWMKIASLLHCEFLTFWIFFFSVQLADCN